jgi:hypothetical protein
VNGAFYLFSSYDMPMILYLAYGSYLNDSLATAADTYVVKSSDLSELKTWVHELAKG